MCSYAKLTWGVPFQILAHVLVTCHNWVLLGCIVVMPIKAPGHGKMAPGYAKTYKTRNKNIDWTGHCSMPAQSKAWEYESQLYLIQFEMH